ncbi:NAD(P)-dependent oxidoreductase [Paenarthrobacter sp. YJN-5]|uniref:NAD-dependent epimerase/dehydratase family protein n=1 Tax=Paenarthrobacter sp. YJN-5 TaxID=2735316 RepID=UPI0018788CAC|nr:NAD(P)-dependent oxidoreductase [Paenarthrobacter sp. YJN-5]QOT19826.1 NAD(P)-dependent oxidoreductase [Paenarthrobacter sp. YJN-5]
MNANTDPRTDAVLVTGASGLLGSVVAARLRERGTKVIATDVTPKTNDVIACDASDATAVETIVAQENVTDIIHCGAISGPMVSRDAPRTIVDINIGGITNILEAARVHRLRRVVFCSSLTVYGNTAEGPVPETTQTSPTSVYAASKVAGEALISSYAAQHGVDGIALRIGTVYGPGRRTACFVRTMIQNAAAGQPTVLPFGRDFPRQYLYVDDAAEAIICALDAKSPQHRVFNVTGNSYLTMAEVAEVAATVIPGIDVHLEDGPDPDDSDRQGPLSPERAKDELGYEARWSLADGLKAYATKLAEDTVSV